MSNDTIIGNPYNVAGYAAITHVLAHLTGMEVGELVISMGDTHIYADQLPLMDQQLEREPLPLAKLTIDPELKSLDDIQVDSFRLEGYRHHPAIKYPVAV